MVICPIPGPMSPLWPPQGEGYSFSLQTPSGRRILKYDCFCIFRASHSVWNKVKHSIPNERNEWMEGREEEQEGPILP